MGFQGIFSGVDLVVHHFLQGSSEEILIITIYVFMQLHILLKTSQTNFIQILPINRTISGVNVCKKLMKTRSVHNVVRHITIYYKVKCHRFNNFLLQRVGVIIFASIHVKRGLSRWWLLSSCLNIQESFVSETYNSLCIYIYINFVPMIKTLI